MEQIKTINGDVLTFVFFEKPGRLHFGRKGEGTQGPPPMRSLPLVLSLLLTEGVSPRRPLGEERVH